LGTNKDAKLSLAHKSVPKHSLGTRRNLVVFPKQSLAGIDVPKQEIGNEKKNIRVGTAHHDSSYYAFELAGSARPTLYTLR